MKASKLMLFTKETIYRDIPDHISGVIYLRGIADEHSLYPVYYVSRAQGSTIKEQLLNLLLTKGWNDAVYMNYVECKSEHEACELEKADINRYIPKYNATETKNEEVYVSSLRLQQGKNLY